MCKRLEILYITPNAPWPTNTGSSQRSNLVWQALNQVGNVHLVCLQTAEGLGKENCDVLYAKFGLKGIAPRTSSAEKWPWKFIAKFNRTFAAQLGNFFDASKSRYEVDKKLMNTLDIERAAIQADIVVTRYLHTAACLGLLDSDTPVVVDIDDLDSSALASQIDAIGIGVFQRWMTKRHFTNIRKTESQTYARAKALWVANPDDTSEPGLERARYLPNIPFQAEGECWNTAAPAIGVIGCLASYGHAPNVEAIDWFLKEVWPTVIAQRASTKFNIYGSQLQDNLRQRWSQIENVNVVGFVDHVENAYKEMSFAVCPVQRGAGTNIKVLEAGFHNRICVVTSSASRGIITSDSLKRAVPICESATDMINIILKYLNNGDTLEKHTSLFSKTIKDNYSKDMFLSTVQSTIEANIIDNQVPPSSLRQFDQ